jgi:hypothetical protein
MILSKEGTLTESPAHNTISSTQIVEPRIPCPTASCEVYPPKVVACGEVGRSESIIELHLVVIALDALLSAVP